MVSREYPMKIYFLYIRQTESRDQECEHQEMEVNGFSSFGQLFSLLLACILESGERVCVCISAKLGQLPPSLFPN